MTKFFFKKTKPVNRFNQSGSSILTGSNRFIADFNWFIANFEDSRLKGGDWTSLGSSSQSNQSDRPVWSDFLIVVFRYLIIKIFILSVLKNIFREVKYFNFVKSIKNNFLKNNKLNSEMEQKN